MTHDTNTHPSKTIHFENHLKERVMEIHFPHGYALRTLTDVQELKTAWSQNLKRWHSPYTVLFDLRQFHVENQQQEEFKKLVLFFEKFFMKKIVGFTEADGYPDPNLIPFSVVKGYEQAAQKAGLSKGAGLTRDLGDLRQRIQCDNDFNAHVMEVSFLAPTLLDTSADMAILKSKLQNMLMLWHSPYSVLFRCENLKFSEVAKGEFQKIERFLKGFFCKQIIGYEPSDAREAYPFPVHRFRHQAAAALEHSGLQSGDQANCSSRRNPKGDA